MKKKLCFTFVAIIVLSFFFVSVSAEKKTKKSKVDAVILRKLKEQAEKARNDIKNIQGKIKPLKVWVKEHRKNWYPEEAFAKSILRTLKKKNKKIRNLLLDSVRQTSKKANLFRKTMGVKKKHLKLIFLYLYYLTTKASPDGDSYSKFIFLMAKSSKTLKKCVICYNMVRVLKFVSNEKYISKLKEKLKKVSGGKLNIVEGLKPVVKNLVKSGNSKDTFESLFMEVKVVKSLKESLKSKTLYYQQKVKKVKKISVYQRRIRNIRHLYYRMIGSEKKREKEELAKQMKKFGDYTKLKVGELEKQKKRAVAGILSLKKMLQKIETKLETIHSLTFRQFVAKKNHLKKE